jgi:hypothetical protein
MEYSAKIPGFFQSHNPGIKNAIPVLDSKIAKLKHKLTYEVVLN